jgi:2-keto-3-deoxy-L-fuconate dehydrogenase
MSNRLENKVTLITAAGQGIGRATAIRFEAEGATVWASDINSAALDTLHAELLAIHTRILDVRDSGAIEAVAKEIGRLDVLFNCAGFVHKGSVFECTEEDWNFSLDLNVSSMYRTCRAFFGRDGGPRRGKHYQYVFHRIESQGRAKPLRLRSYKAAVR